MRYWPFQITVTPMLAAPTEGRPERRKALSAREAVDGLRAILANDAAVAVIHSLTLSCDRPLSITCVVPRVSDDAEADARAIDALINEAARGEPT